MTDTTTPEDRLPAADPPAGWHAGPGVQLAVDLTLLALGAGYLVLAVQLGFWDEDRPGAGFYPVLVGTLLLVCLVGDMIRRKATAGTERSPRRTTRLPWRIVIVLASVLAYLVLVPVVGHLIITMLIVTALVMSFSRRPWWQVVIAAVGTAVGTDLLFGELLGVRLDDGWFGIGFGSWM